MLVRHNIVPEQVLFEAGCPDYQDERAFPVLAQAAENLMRVGCDSTDGEIYLTDSFVIRFDI
jgi:hypothetical protein